MSVYGLEVRYNGKSPLRCFSGERGGVGAHLYTRRGGYLRLDVLLKRAGKRREYSLPMVVPGDSLSFKFLRRTRSGGQSMTRLHQFARKPVRWRRTPKKRRKRRKGAKRKRPKTKHQEELAIDDIDD